jgi:hypothetical protein
MLGPKNRQQTAALQSPRPVDDYLRMKLALAVLGLACGFLLSLVVRTPEARGAREKGVCDRWQTTAGPFANQLVADRPPEIGTPTISTSPSGWEPFAVGPHGVVYRRCAP